MQIKGVRIFEDAYKGITLDLKNIISLIDKGDSYFWTVYGLEVTMSLNASQEGLKIYEMIENSKTSCNLTWSELKVFSQNVFQVMDGYFLASHNHKDLKLYPEEIDIIKNYDISIIMNDAYYWDIFTQDQEFYKKIISLLKIDKKLEMDI